MMRMLTGYLAPSAGEAAIAGHDVRQDRIAASARLGYLPENGPMYPDMTPLELLRFFGEARRMAPATLRERMDAVVDLCALELVTEKPIGKLSRGYRQRVGMAQALLHDPDVLIMDEPTAGLDPNQIRQFRENIQRLGRTKTLLISTHILQEADAVADRVLLVNSGRLVFDGPVEDLREGGSLEQPFYRLTAGGAAPTGGGDGGPGDGGDGKSAAADDGGGGESGGAAADGGGAEDKTADATKAAGTAGAETKTQTDAKAAGAGGTVEPEAPGAAADAGGTGGEVPRTGSAKA